MSEITAKNYVGQAVQAFKKASWVQGREKWVALLSTAVHFVMPDGGRIFNDNVKGLYGNELKLPYPRCTLEFYMPGYAYGCKQVIVLLENEKTESIEIISIISKGKNDAYDSPDFLPNLISLNITKREFIDAQKEPKFILRGLKLDPEKWDGTELEGVREAATRIAMKSGAAALEFLEAMSCKNVEAVTYQKASPKNAQRIKSHKAPIYETKILSLVMPQKVAKGEKLFGTHASPRQHLRRGHIRRLDTGNIWVNACVVGDASNGIINKQYKVST